MMFRFQSLWMLLLLLLVPVAVYLHRRGKQRGALLFSTVPEARRAGRSLRQRLLGTPLVIRVTALVLLAFALARPQRGTERVVDTSRGVAIEMVVDRSSSMSAEFRYHGRRVSRLQVALQLFRDFVLGGSGTLKGRPSDLIGLITFARYADTICPLTLSHNALVGFLPTVKIVDQRSEDGTAIGDAVALAAARLKTVEQTLAHRGGKNKGYQIKSKVIILLTDGQNNAGKHSVQQAADMAAAWGIKIYAIGIGGQANSVIQTPFGAYTIPVGQYFTGAFEYLVFAMDHDVASPTGNSVFSNVIVYENTAAPAVTFLAAEGTFGSDVSRSEEHTSELQSH